MGYSTPSISVMRFLKRMNASPWPNCGMAKD
jgi:hypothetical protein